MPTDCVTLSANAAKIFAELEPFFPPDSWKRPSWQAEGLVRDAASARLYDLRKAADRQHIQESYRGTIASLLETVASSSSLSFEEMMATPLGKLPFASTAKGLLQKLVILHRLDFQIETMDNVEADMAKAEPTET